MKTKFLVILNLVIFFNVSAQLINGKIFSSETNNPMPYSRVGLEKNKFGVTSDEYGNFSIDLSNQDKNQNIRIEVGGYEPMIITFNNFISQNNKIFYLSEKIVDIEQVVLSSKKFIQKYWGINSKGKKIQFVYNPEKNKQSLSKELALPFETKKRAKIEKININIGYFESDKPVFVRYNVYEENWN